MRAFLSNWRSRTNKLSRRFRRKLRKVEVLASDAPHPNAVRLALERRRELRHQAPPVATMLSEHARSRDVAIESHRLDSYDQLSTEETDEDAT